MRVADTSALYAVFDADDAHHAAATKALADPEPIAVPTEILGETIGLIEYRMSWNAAKAALEDLRRTPHLRLAERVDPDAVASVFVDSRGKLSLSDAVVVQTCRALAAKPLAFDRDILAACKARG